MRHKVVHILPYAPDQLLRLVGDVEAYPQFVPWITGMRVWNRRDEGGGASQLDAETVVRFGPVRERFSTRVRRDPEAGEILVGLLHGPFRRLVNRWRIHPHPQGAQVEFEIDFEFKTKILHRLLAANFEHAVERLIGCFEDRARQLFGSA